MMLLNLTSPDVHTTLKLRAQIAIARTVTVVISLALVGFIGSGLVGKSLLTKKAKDVQGEAERSTLLLRAQGQASIADTTKKLNLQVTTLQKIQARYVQWTPVISNFALLTPSGITLRSINLDQRSGKLTFDALAATREAYVEYEKVLQASPLFQNVQFPLQTLKTAIAFSNTITVVSLPKP